MKPLTHAERGRLGGLKSKGGTVTGPSKARPIEHYIKMAAISAEKRKRKEICREN